MVRGVNQQQQWADLRRRIRVFWIVFLGFIPGLALTQALVHLAFPMREGAIVPYVAFGWLMAFVAAGYYRTTFTCPNCGGYFFDRVGWRNPFARKCLHCGLPRWSDPGHHT